MLTYLELTYSVFKQVIYTLPVYYVTSGDILIAFSANSTSLFKAFILQGNISDFNTTYPSAVEVQTQDDAIALSGMNFGDNQAQKQTDGATLIATVGREGSETIQATHDFTKKETWYTTSNRVTNELLSDSGDGLTFSGSNKYWIDMTHGKVYDEDAICLDISHGYSVDITVTGSLLTPRTPFSGSGGEYTVNYRSGSVTFATAPSSSVTASYSYAVDSTWILQPSGSKFIDIEEAEVHFSSNVEMNDTIQFGAQGWVQVFAPSLWTGNGGPLATNTLITIDSTNYKTFFQIIDESVSTFTSLPIINSVNGRGTNSQLYQSSFRYGAVKRLHSLYGMQLFVKLVDDIEFGGDRASATFYCMSRNETSID